MSEHFVSGFLYFLFLFFCFFFVPCWAWFKRKRKMLAAGLVLIALFFGYLIFGYFRDPGASEDHGMVVLGFLFFIPPFTFLLQLLVYGVTNIVNHLSSKRKNV